MSEEEYYLSEMPTRDMFKVTLALGQPLADRFKIVQLLGEGRFSRVCLVDDSVRSEQVALKVVGVTKRSATKPLMEEIKQHARITNYSHVIRVYELHLIECGGAFLACLSMEYADGGCLRDWLRRYKDRPAVRRDQGLEYFRQACVGVGELHAAGIVHGDIKPENLLLAAGEIKVADLSLSGAIRSAANYRNPESGSPAGTPAYMSPEQIVAQHYQGVDVRADIYSLGIMLSEILRLEGHVPFQGSAHEILRSHLKRSPPSLDDIEPRLACIIGRCLQKNPADRYKDIPALLRDLNGDASVESAVASEEEQRLARQRDVEQLWAQAYQAFTNDNLEGAAPACHAILKIISDHPNAKAMLEEIERRSASAQQAYELIERGIGYQSFDYLNTLLLEAIRMCPNHPRGRLVQVQLGTMARQFRQMMAEAARDISQQQYESALANLDRARQLAPGESAVTRLMNLAMEAKQEVELTRGKIDTALEQGDRRKALTLARALDRYTDRIRQLAE